MSALETSAQPVLNRLWAGERVVLTSAEVAVLARWAVKTSWMHERARYESATPTAAQRRAIMEARPPVLTRVWAARHVGEMDFRSPIMRARAGHQALSWDAEPKRHVMIAALVCHGLALLVRTDDGTGCRVSVWTVRRGCRSRRGRAVADSPGRLARS
jgi:hypothetical protein